MFGLAAGVWSVLIALFDGYDIAAIALAAPHLVADWHVERSALGPVLAASGSGGFITVGS